jgi:hypothetical protein
LRGSSTGVPSQSYERGERSKRRLKSAYEGYAARLVYVTPPIDGWVLVAGTSLFSHFAKTRADEAHIPEKVAALSATLGTEVQYFATHRVSEAHSWIRADSGRVIRAYSLADGEVPFDLGTPTDAEKALAINFDIDDDGPDLTPATRDAYREWASHRVDEEMVIRVASRWSVDPNLEGRMLPQGWLGTLPG